MNGRDGRANIDRQTFQTGVELFTLTRKQEGGVAVVVVVKACFLVTCRGRVFVNGSLATIFFP